MVERITDQFQAEYGFDSCTRIAVLGAVRIGMIEATRGCMYAVSLSPSTRIGMEEYWGLSGTARIHPANTNPNLVCSS